MQFGSVSKPRNPTCEKPIFATMSNPRLDVKSQIFCSDITTVQHSGKHTWMTGNGPFDDVFVS